MCSNSESHCNDCMLSAEGLCATCYSSDTNTHSGMQKFFSVDIVRYVCLLFDYTSRKSNCLQKFGPYGNRINDVPIQLCSVACTMSDVSFPGKSFGRI